MTKYEGKERAYYASLKFALEDGMIDHTEFTHLSDVREQLGITTELHNKMESEIRAAAPPPMPPPSSSVKDSVISKSTITTVGGDYIDDRDTIQYGTGAIENSANMCIDAVQAGKLKDGVDIYNKAKEINIEEAKETFMNKYGKEIAAAYVIAAVPLLEAAKTGELGYMGLIFTRRFNECTVCIGNALAFDPDNIEANIMKGQAYLTFSKRETHPAHPDLVKKEAIARFEKALSLDSGNRVAQEGLVEARQMSTAKNNCFITTATVNYMGEADNGQTLTALRNFRDTVMNKTVNGRKQLDWYYENAPDIVKSLDSLENKEEVYTKLYNSYIFPAANAYRNRQKHDTFNLYKKGIQFAFKCIDSKSLI